jgi:D-alanyl-D-alanine carboxypeptidase
MRTNRTPLSAFILVVALAGCGSTPAATGATASVAPSATPPGSVEPSATLVPSAAPTKQARSFPTDAFADISEEPLPDAKAAQLQAILSDMAGGAGISATVMSAQGTWSGVTGKADGVRDVRVDDQFAIASITKSVVAAQVMQLVEAGALDLDDPAAEHLAADFAFDTYGATIRQLLGHRSGLPGYDPALFDPGTQESPTSDLQRAWTPAEVFKLLLRDRVPPGDTFDYNNTNYLVLGEVIEHVSGRPIAEVLRAGVLKSDGLDRLIYQPGEAPSQPMAMPFGKSTDVLKRGGGYLPSRAGASIDGAAAAMASDSPSLARWWRALCAGEIVSQASLTEMTTFVDGYGLGLYQPDPPGTVGHGGEHIGYVSLAGCMPADGVAFAVLVNRNADVVDVSAVAAPLVRVAASP